MWRQPATAKQIAALKANGNFDGKYYSKGRAGQTIGESVRQRDGENARIDLPSTPRTPTSSHRPLSSGPISQVPSPTPPPLRLAADVPSEAVGGADSTPALPGAGVLSFAFVTDLEKRHLQSFQSEHSSNWGAELRRESHDWAHLRVKIAKMLSDGHEELVGILREAPKGAVPDPAAAATSILASCAPGELEERHLRAFMSEHSSNWGAELRREIREWVRLRIDLARSAARTYVDVATTRAAQVSTANDMSDAPTLATAPAAAPAQKSTPSKGTQRNAIRFGIVDRINAHGAQIMLESGERGWLHISKLRVLNDGEPVDDVRTFLEVGRRIRVRAIGTNERGQVVLALVRSNRSAPDRRSVEPAEVVPPNAVPPSAETRRGFLARFRTSHKESE